RLVKRDFGTEPVVIEHGVEEWLPEVQWSPSGYVLYSGRIEKYKNVHRLANIVKHLREFGKDLELKVIGNGSYTHRLIRHLRRLKIPYELKPPQPYRDYVNYLSKANLLGLLSEKEAFGQIVNEANAIGVPAVVAEPWGITFSSRSRVLITRLDMPDYEIAKKIAEFIEKAKNQPKPSVLTWSQVVDLYIKHLY
ncbi:MAG: glycosyltransferase, partial [Pyrobaculum sp.]